MQQATQLQLLPSGQSSFQPQPTPNFQDKAGTLCSQPQCEQPASRETPLQQLDKGKTVPRHIPRLRAVVESQAFKNVLVDEMDLMLSHAATLIQANWRGYRLRQKLISQMLAAKAIQEAWRRLHTRRLLRSGKEVGKKGTTDEGDIPYHPPQQVRFQSAEEGKLLPAPPVMVSRETQSPSANDSAAFARQLALGQPPGTPQPSVQAPCDTGGPSVTFLPQQTVSMRLPCPVNPDAKNHPCLLTRTIRSTSFIHTEGDTMKTKKVITRANKGGAPEPPPSGRCAQEPHKPLKTQTQGPVEAEVLKTPPQTGQTSTMTKTPLQQCPVSTITTTKTPPQMYPATAVTKTALQSCLASMMNKTLLQPRPAPIVTITKTPPQVDQAAPVAKTPFQSCLAAVLSKHSTQPCPVPSVTITKTPPQPCLTAPMTKTPAQMRPTASMTNTIPQVEPAALLAKISPQICLLTSMIKPPTETCPVPMVAKTQPQTSQVPVMPKTPPQTSQVPVMPKTPPQTCQVPVMAKTPPQPCPSATMAKTPLQTCPVASMAKTPSQTVPGASMTKIPPQTRLAAMITKTPAQLRSMATILRTLCQPPSAAGNLKASPPAVVAAGIPNTSSHTCLNRPKAKAVVTGRRTAGMVKVSSHSHLTEGKVKYCPPPHLGAGAPKALARPSLEGEKIKVFSQKQVKAATMSNTSVSKDRSKVLSQAQLKKDVKVQSKVYMPVEMNVALPQAELGTRPAKALPQAQMATCSTPASSRGHLFAKLSVALPQENLGTCLSKPPCQAHLPAKLSKARTLAHRGTCLTKMQSPTHLTTRVIKVQSQVDLPTGLTKAQTQVPLVSETAKCPYTAHEVTEKGKTQSQPLLAGFKSSAQPCQQPGPLGTLSRAKPEDRLTQLPAHGYAQGKAPQGPHQEASETQSMLVPLLSSTGHLTCNVESCGDSGTTWAQSSTTSPATPCQKELVASQLASLCAELATLLGSQEDLRDLLAKALSQGEVRAALNQALSKEVLGTMMAKVLPQGMLGTALVKALSWGELGATLSHALSRGELRAELTKAMQGKLGDMLSKALTEEEWATLNQALCQGELGAILSQSLSQAALRSGLILPKAASKTLESGMTVTPAPVEVTYKGSPATAWGPTLGCVRPQTSKGPVDAGVAGGQAWKPAVPSVAVRPMNSAETPRGAWAPARCTVPWDAVGSRVAVDPRRLGELVASVQTVEKIIVQAVITIQACARGYLVRRTVRVWHQWAVIIQAAWRGHCTRRNLAQLCKAATVIQAAWRGHFTRRRRAQQMLLPAMWAGVGDRVQSTSNHRCFQSCQPKACTLCQSLSPQLGTLPSAVMLVGSSPRTCHMCGQTLPTRVVQGMGQGSTGQAGMPWGRDTRLTRQNPRRRQLGQNEAAVIIQSTWRGFIVRRRLRQQQVAAKMLQATWRGHYTRISLTTDALLGPAAWDSQQNMQWPGV